MLNDMREPLGAALLHLGYSANSTNPDEIEQAARQLVEWKKNIAVFSVEDAREGLRKNDYVAIQTYNGEFTMAAQTDPDIEFYVPREGSMLNSDLFAIGADTEQSELAHAFINFFLRPDIAAINMEDAFYYMPNGAALDIVRKNPNINPAFFTSQLTDRCEVVRSLGPDTDLYDSAWAEVLFSDSE
jgi:spermidine/putrescine transport system substrate-binding protein